MHTLRFADPATADAYPLQVAGPARWQSDAEGSTVEFALPALPAGTIIVPSLAARGASGDRTAAYHQWTLIDADATWRLPAAPAHPSAPPPSRTDSRVSLHIDCWHLHEPLTEPRVQVRLSCRHAPARYLICASARALDLPVPAAPASLATLRSPPPARSQMSAPAELARRICSPTSLAMVLEHWGCRGPWLDIVEECRDPASGLYGVWPLALAAAARRGFLGAVEAFSDWTEPLAVLARGIPLVTSIRFEAGLLPGAPLPRTAGHLVVVFGAGPDAVAVNDPAAATPADVTRSYPAAAFTEAWLAHRGAAYIVPP